jgi:hypothetical protein
MKKQNTEDRRQKTEAKLAVTFAHSDFCLLTSVF